MSNKAKFLAITIFVLLLTCGCSSPPETALVTRVIDGDTIVIKGGYHIRYIGIDTPEIHHELEAYGKKALQANRELVEGKIVRLERDVSQTDKYGRLLRSPDEAFFILHLTTPSRLTAIMALSCA